MAFAAMALAVTVFPATAARAFVAMTLPAGRRSRIVEPIIDTSILGQPGREVDAWSAWTAADVAWRIGGARSDVEAAEGIDELGEPRPAEAELLAVLESADDRLVDAGICPELALGPAEGDAASPQGLTEQVEASLLLGIALVREPGHARTLARRPYQPLTGSAA